MKLDTEFYKLPLALDRAQLAQEGAQFSEADWTAHSTGILGYHVIPLVSVGGTLNDDFAISGAMQTTPFLERCPYLQQIIQILDIPVSRTYLMRLEGTTETPVQINQNYHRFRRLPIHIPLLTQPEVQFFCNDQAVHMAAGQAWVFNPFQRHWLVNPSAENCIHLVIETKGSVTLELLLSQVDRPSGVRANLQDLKVVYQPDQPTEITLEPYCFEVLTPSEVENLTAAIIQDLEVTEMAQVDLERLLGSIETFKQEWTKAFDRFGHSQAGELTYWELILRFKDQIGIRGHQNLPVLSRGHYAIAVISSMLTTTARPVLKKTSQRFLLRKKPRAVLEPPSENLQLPQFDRPIFIVSAPRAGSTLLFETLSRFAEVWTIGEESHDVIEGIPELHPAARDFESNRLSETDASPQVVATLKERFARQLQNREGYGYLDLPPEQRPQSLRFVEKTPRNALRIPFLRAAFPSALFIYLYREPKENISSMMEGWRSRRFVSYRQLSGWPFREWSFLLPPDWSSLQQSPLAEIAAYQWKVANSYILDDLREGSPDSWCLIRFADLIQDPRKTLRTISEFAGLQWDEAIDQQVGQSLPISKMVLSAPSPDKWRKNERELATVLLSIQPFVSALEEIQ
jgi:hypothetical protein